MTCKLGQNETPSVRERGYRPTEDVLHQLRVAQDKELSGLHTGSAHVDTDVVEPDETETVPCIGQQWLVKERSTVKTYGERAERPQCITEKLM